MNFGCICPALFLTPLFYHSCLGLSNKVVHFERNIVKSRNLISVSY